ncbi:MAG: YggT family protein [Anaerolineaceae bacterium]
MTIPLLLIQIIRAVAQLASIAVMVDVILSYFMSPYQPIRRALDGIVEPMLNPIRRVMPNLGGLDFSPVVLIVVIQLVETLLVTLLSRLV